MVEGDIGSIPVISPDMRQLFPVAFPQALTSAWPQSHSEYRIVLFTLSRASRMRWYRFAVVEVAQSYPWGAASVRFTQVPLG